MDEPLIIYNNMTLISVLVYATSGTFALLATTITAFLIGGHLRHFVYREAQTYIMRILLMVPIYAIDSWLSLFFVEYSVYFDVIRDMYESFVLYEFFNLLICYFNRGAPAYFSDVENGIVSDEEESISFRLVPLNCTDQLSEASIDICSLSEEDEDEGEKEKVKTDAPVTEEEEKPVVVNDERFDKTSFYLSKFGFVRYPSPLCCLPASFTDQKFYIRIRRLVFQYIVIKPILSVVALILHALHMYHPGSFNPTHGYLWITIVMNISVAVALYALILFYRLILPAILIHQPLYKLLAIKAILFVIFWQSVAITCIGRIPGLFVFLYKGTLWHEEALGAIFNNWLICFEMFILSIANLFIFPYNVYKDEEQAHVEVVEGKKKRTYRHFTKVLNPKDVIRDSKNVILGKEK